MPRYSMLVSYDGSEFHGWQRQPDHISVQEALESALSTIFQTPISVVGAGRTDTGVHAIGQVAHFDHTFDHSLSDLRFRLNTILPPSVSILDLNEEETDFHARFSAIGRQYRYQICTVKHPLLRHTHWEVRSPLLFDKLQHLSECIEGDHDFTGFSKQGNTEHNRCIIQSADWMFESGNRLTFTIHGNRFLHHMVRMLTGSMILVASGKSTIEDFKTRLSTGHSASHVLKAPAHGLILEGVLYDRK